MALTLQNPPAALGGKEALKTALESFRQSLTDGERQRLVEMQVSDPAKPDENKVMMLIAEIDCQNSRKFSRYVAPKLQPFLDVIQQFSSAVDTFMTSGPPVAQVVWGSVKVTLLIVSNFGQYFEKLATLFDSIGKACPRIREFGTLYESSTSLQDLVCRYFAGVIEICGKVLKVSRRPGIKQFSIAAFKPFEREFGESRDDLKQISELIKEEVSLASNRIQVQEAKLDDLERKENAGFRSIVAKWNSRTAKDLEEILQLQVQAEKRRVERNRKAVRDNLCLLDPTKAWKQARKQCLVGTATWFEESEEFRQWLGQKDSATIWYPGKMGSGKSILTSNVITYLMRLGSSSDRMSYFFCQDEIPETLLSQNIIGSIARQMLDSVIESATGNKLQRLVTESSNLDTEGKTSFILSHYHLPGTCFIVVDGLDQCEMTEVDSVLVALGHLVDQAPPRSCLKLFVSSRPEISRRLNNTLSPKFRLTPTPEALREDISTYIEATLYNKLASEQLQLNDITHIQAIQSALLIGAQGM
jgi:NACHT domain